MRIKKTGAPIFAGPRWARSLSAFLKAGNYSAIFILCDENTFQHCLPHLITSCPILAPAEIIETEAGEAAKSMEIAARIWETLTEKAADRNSLLINLGGGVITDLGGFCASVYKRGISFVNIPTTLLAMADASVGGKNAVNFGGFKNMLGTFAEPDCVVTDAGFLRTLPERHFKNGLAEVYKIALVSDKKFWKQLVASQAPPDPDKLVSRSIHLKSRIVRKDPFDKGIRKILNFGHSIGHAIELEACSALLHGESVVAGMIAESHIAWQKKLITAATLKEITQALQARFCDNMPRALDAEQILTGLKQDKKSARGRYYFALITGTGSCSPQVEVGEGHVRKAIAYYNSLQP